jgi:pimeloyl-ACP methyl ester carboxylesterase
VNAAAGLPGSPGVPDLPPGRALHLPGRGTTFVREAESERAGAAGRPALVLLHGWTVTSDLNWFGVYAALAEHFRVVAVDFRGHGRGIRAEQPFSLEACADDVLAVADHLGLGRFVAVGYSMGGLVAQLAWRRDRGDGTVAGLVLAATALSFQGTVGDRVYFGGLAALSRAYRVAPAGVRDPALNRYLTARTGRLDPWAAAEVASGDIRAYLEAGCAIGTFHSREWIGEVDVPTAVLVNTRDRTVPTWRQRDLAAALPSARVFEIDGDHHVVAKEPDRFAPLLVEACEWAVSASPGRRPPPPGGPRR